MTELLAAVGAADPVPPGTVVVGLDLTEHWHEALDWAIDQAVREHRAISLVHALGPQGAGASHAVSAAARLLDDARERVALRAPEVPVHTVLRTGQVVRVLHETAAGARLLVVGTRALPTLWDHVAGTTGGKVARHPPCAVVIVRPRTHRAAGVLVAVGDAPVSRDAVEFAAAHAARAGSALTVLHVEPATGVRLRADHDEDAAARRRLEATVADLRGAFPEVPVRSAVVRGDPVGCILRAGRGMALIVLGAHRPSPVSLVLGTTVSPVLRRAACPVAVVP